jgi:hypothetical protein
VDRTNSRDGVGGFRGRERARSAGQHRELTVIPGQQRVILPPASGLRLLAFPAGQGGFAVESLVRLAVLLAIAASRPLTVSRARGPFASLNITYGADPARRATRAASR